MINNISVIIFIILFILLIFIIIKQLLNKKETFCYGNDFCNGNINNALCINQQCRKCGLVAPCNKNSDCGPNLCKDGCCDTA